MNKKIKKAAALMLCIIIITVTVEGCRMEARASALAGAALSAWEAIVGSAAGYAGYNATKKQTKDISGILGGMVDSFVGKASSTVWPGKVTYNGWMDWVKQEYGGDTYYDAYKNLASALWRERYESVMEKLGHVPAEEVKEGVDELQDSLAMIDNEKNDGDDGKENPWIKGVTWLAGAAVKVIADKGFEYILSQAVDGIVKVKYNAEYEKMKGKYDWEKLGFVSDYDTLEISASSTDKFSNYSDQNIYFNKDYTILQTEKVNDYTCIMSVAQGNEKTALVTIRNPESGLWKTVFLTEKQLYYYVNSVKTGAYNFKDIDELINQNTVTSEQSGLPNRPLASIYRYSTGGTRVGNEAFLGLMATGVYSVNPLTVTFRLNGGGICEKYLEKSNTTVYNLGKTMNVYFWNFRSDTEYTGSTTALNGLDEIAPAVKSSKYTNTASEIDKAGNITINIDKSTAAVDTDEIIKTIAEENDLILKTQELIEDNTEVSRNILTVLQNLPGRIYDFFSGILGRILKAIKDNPLQMYNYIKDPITAIEASCNAILSNLPQSVTAQLPGLDKITAVLDKMDLNLSTTAGSLVDIVGSGYTVGLLPSIVNQFPTLLESVSANGTSLASILEAIKDIDITGGGDVTLGDISASLVNIPVTIQANFEASVKLLFVPESTSVNDTYTKIDKSLQEKLPYAVYMKFVEDLRDIKSQRATNITADIGGTEVTFVNFDYYYNNLDSLAPYFKGVFFMLLLFFNIRHMYFLVRGKNMMNSGSD